MGFVASFQCATSCRKCGCPAGALARLGSSSQWRGVVAAGRLRRVGSREKWLCISYTHRCHGEGPRRRRLLLRLTSPRTRRVGGEAWPSGVRVSPARPAGARVPHPFPWQRLARPHACAPVSAAAPPQRLQRCKSFCTSLFKLSSPLNQSPPAAPAAPAARPQPPVLSVPCGAGGGRPVVRGASGTPWWGARQGRRTRSVEKAV